MTTSHPTAAPLQTGDPLHVGPYTLRGRLGAGGMGRVYLATDPTGDLVAVKIMAAEFADNPVFRDRFRREADAARRVPRFCTAAVRDADPHATPPYLVTDYVPGPTLTAAVRDGPLHGADLEQLAINMATALSMIHAVGVVHRDLKPGNVLLSPTGARVIDFGIAVAHDMTVINGPDIGTPTYMAPEAFQGAPPSPAMDVFAWGGVVLFAATHTPPFEPEPAALLPHRITHDQPAHLHRLTEPLRSAVLAAMAKDPAARPDAAQLYRMLTGPTPAPAPTSPSGNGRSWTPDLTRIPPPPPRQPIRPPAPSPPAPPATVRRRPIVRGAAVAVAALAAVTYLATTAFHHGNRSTSLTVAQRSSAAQTLTAAARTTSDPALAMRLAVAAWHLAPTSSGDTLLATVAGRLPPLLQAGHAGPITNLALSADGQTLATASKDGTARLWDLTHPTAQPAPLATLSSPPVAINGVSLSPDGRTAVTTSDDNTIRLWNISNRTAPTPTSTYTLAGAGRIHGATLDPTGHTAAVTTNSGQFLLLDVTGGQLSILATVQAHDAVAVAAFAPHRNVLVTASLDGTARLWDLTNPHSPQPAGRISLPAALANIAVSPNGATLAIAHTDGTVSLWDITAPASPQPLATLPPTASTAATAAAFDATSRRLAATDSAGTLHLWDLTNPHNPRTLTTIHAHNNMIYDVAADGAHLITAGSDGTAKLWDLDPGSLYHRACLTGGSAVLTAEEWSRLLPHVPYQSPCPLSAAATRPGTGERG